MSKKIVYVSRDKVIKALEQKAKKIKNEDTVNGLCGAVSILYELEPEDVRKNDHTNLVDYFCEKCGTDMSMLRKSERKYCPKCGAKIDKELHGE